MTNAGRAWLAPLLFATSLAVAGATARAAPQACATQRVPKGGQFGKAVTASGGIAFAANRAAAGTSGVVYVFERDPLGAWVEVATIQGTDTSPGDWFGESLEADGDRLVVGAYLAQSGGLEAGAVYVFERDLGGAAQWGQAKKLAGSTDGSLFGSEVGVSGDVIAVGATEDPTACPTFPHRGAVFVYERDMGGVGNWGLATRIESPCDLQGYGGVLAVSGGTLVVGAGDELHVFERDHPGAGQWGLRRTVPSPASGQAIGYALALEGDTLAATALLAPGVLGVHVFGRDVGGPDAWGLVRTIANPDPEIPGFSFGYAVALEGDRLWVSRGESSSPPSGTGAVFAFDRNAGGPDGWALVEEEALGQPGDGFGSAAGVGDGVITGSWKLGVVDFLRFDCPAASYCTAGTTTNGCSAAMTGTGTPSASAGSGFTLAAVGVEGQKPGLVFYGISGPLAAPWGASSSYRCVRSPVQRTPFHFSGGTAGSCDGTLSIDFNAYVQANVGALGSPFGVGDEVWSQAWFRDPPSPETTHLSNGFRFLVGP